jgi:4-alpha-glucanotransferase
LAAGAPADAYQALGQRWGMPPYNWPAIAADRNAYLVRKLRYAERFFDCYRIDHFVGIFRLWTIKLSEPLANAGLQGAFDPSDEAVWEEHGRRLLTAMLNSTHMLPCAEDLGVVPACSYRVLESFGVNGMDVQRWMRDWDTTGDFKPGDAYRPNAIAVVSTHDMSTLRDWWEQEAGTIDEALFRQRCPSRGLNADALIARLFDPQRSHAGRLYWRRDIDSEHVFMSILQRRPEELQDFLGWYRSSFSEQAQFWAYVGMPGPWQVRFSPELGQRALEAANRTRAIFSVQPLQEWLSFAPEFLAGEVGKWRINVPGTSSPDNWSVVFPFALEALLTRPENRTLLDMNQRTGRS